MKDSELVSIAMDAMKNSYAPYSGFNVGAALLCEDGSIYTGCNIENAAYTPSVCAERVAFFKAVADGKREFNSIAVVGGPCRKITSLCTPCGVCRQVMSEFCDGSFKIICKDKDDIKTFTLSQLLPEHFGPEVIK